MRRLVALIVLSAAGCTAPPSPPAPAPPRASASLAPADADADRHLAMIERVTDYRNYALLTQQTPPPGYQSITRAGALPRVFASAKVYYANFDNLQSRAHPGILSSLEPGCGAAAIAANGTLCPSVVLPPIDIPNDAAAQLIAIFDNRGGVPVVIMCGGPIATHHLVLYDEHDVPIGEISMDLRCPWIRARPGVASTHMNHPLSKPVRAWCESLQLSGCDDDDPGWKRALDRFGERKPLSPAARGPVNRLDGAAKRELCIWHSQRVGPSFRPGDDARGAEYPDGRRLWARATRWDECMERFPASCESTVEQVLPCMRKAQQGDVWFGDDPHCESLRPCLWGFLFFDAEPPSVR